MTSNPAMRFCIDSHLAGFNDSMKYKLLQTSVLEAQKGLLACQKLQSCLVSSYLQLIMFSNSAHTPHPNYIRIKLFPNKCYLVHIMIFFFSSISRFLFQDYLEVSLSRGLFFTSKVRMASHANQFLSQTTRGQ